MCYHSPINLKRKTKHEWRVNAAQLKLWINCEVRTGFHSPTFPTEPDCGNLIFSAIPNTTQDGHAIMTQLHNARLPEKFPKAKAEWNLNIKFGDESIHESKKFVFSSIPNWPVLLFKENDFNDQMLKDLDQIVIVIEIEIIKLWTKSIPNIPTESWKEYGVIE